jgi:hypothetical protein
MPGCNTAFRRDKKPDVNKNRMLVFFITSGPAVADNQNQATPAHEIESGGLSQAGTENHGMAP